MSKKRKETQYVKSALPVKKDTLVAPVSMVNKIHKTEAIAKILKVAIASAYIKKGDEPPISVMLIAPSEDNKTRLLLLFQKMRGIATVENISPKPLSDLIKEQDDKQKIFHIIILDFNRTLSQKSVVNKALVGTLLNLTDEGVQHSLYYGQKFHLKHRIQIAILTGIIPDIFKKHFVYWLHIGATTRFLWVAYDYNETTEKEIKHSISLNRPQYVNPEITKFKYRGKQEIVLDNPDIQSAINILTDKINDRYKTFYVVRTVGKTQYRVYFNAKGFRLEKTLILFIKTLAYLRGDNKVNYQDLEELQRLSDYFRLPNNPKEI
jgi:hypothetical protein